MKIKLKTYDGKNFVCAENGGGQELTANRTSPREWETFDVIGQFVFGGNISLRTYDGKNFVCAEDGGGRELVANRTEAHQWETFKIIGLNGRTDNTLVQNGDKISLQTYDSKHYVCAEDGGGRELVANRTEAHEWETFTVQFAQYLRIISGFCIRQANVNDKSRIVPIFCCGVTINGSLLIH